MSRVTIKKHHITNKPLGYAYLSFDSEDGVELALHLSGLKHRGRAIRVHRKRTNIKGMGPGGKDKGRDLLNMVMHSLTQQQAGRGKPKGKGK